MKNRKLLILLILGFILGCSSPKELTMPFYNMDYTGDRLFPIESNKDIKVFRAWLNLSTSVERVITVSVDSDSTYNGTLIEFGKHYRKNILKKGYSPSKVFYRKNSIEPINGFENFFAYLSELELISLKDRDEVEILPHEPVALLVIEYKDRDDYNQFRFHFTYRDIEEDTRDEYDKIRYFLIDEFYHNFRFD